MKQFMGQLMEQVVELFGRLRTRHIALKELTDTLKVFLSNHPQAPRQGLGWLDLAQQRQPMPVTEFIQLRADMDYLLRHLAPRAGDVDATRIGNTVVPPRNDSTLLQTQRPNTNNSAPNENGDDNATLIAKPGSPDDDATMPAGAALPHHVANNRPPAAPAGKAVSEAEAATLFASAPRSTAIPQEEEGATLIAKPALADDDATLAAGSAMPRTAASLPNTGNDATLIDNHRSDNRSDAAATQILGGGFNAGNSPSDQEATLIANAGAKLRKEADSAQDEQATLITAEKPALAARPPHVQRPPPRTTQPAAPVANTKFPPLLAATAGVLAAAMVVGGFAYWSKYRSPAVPENIRTSSLSAENPAQEETSTDAPLLDQNAVPVVAADEIAQPPQGTAAPMAVLAKDTETVMLKLEVVESANGDAEIKLEPRNVTNPRPAVQPAPPPEPVETLPTDMAGLLKALKNRIAKGRLLPADNPNSATYALKVMIKKEARHEAVSEARALLSKTHLELAKQAREKGDLDAAQVHLDEAFEVRLLSSQ